MEKDNKKAYSEVIEILKMIDDEKKLEALPIEMLEVLKSKRDVEYKPQISKEIPLEEQNLQPETLPILSWITMKYWKEDMEKEENTENIEAKEIILKEERKENIENAEYIKENEAKTIENPEQKQEKEVLEQENSASNTEENINNLPIVHKELKWYQKIKEKILEFINKIFNKKTKEGKTL